MLSLTRSLIMDNQLIPTGTPVGNSPISNSRNGLNHWVTVCITMILLKISSGIFPVTTISFRLLTRSVNFNILIFQQRRIGRKILKSKDANIWLELIITWRPRKQIFNIVTIILDIYSMDWKAAKYYDKSANEFLYIKPGTKEGTRSIMGSFPASSENAWLPSERSIFPAIFIMHISNQVIQKKTWRILFRRSNSFLSIPPSGQVFTHPDVESYFKRIGVPPVMPIFQDTT